MKSSPPVVWIVPEEQGGIRSYTEALLPEFGDKVLPFWSTQNLAEIPNNSKIIHVQHEFGLFGSKIPGLNRFPSFVRELRSHFPSAKIIATAHSVIQKDFRYNLEGRGIGSIPRAILNWGALPFLVPSWTRGTWGLVDGVVVHSSHQVSTVRDSGQRNVTVIPHFVPSVSKEEHAHFNGEKSVVVFGYFTPEKAQDLAIRAWALLKHGLGKDTPKLILAGGVRSNKDRNYRSMCLRLIGDLGLKDVVQVLGYVAQENVSNIYKKSGFVLAPFRETSGSGSLAQAMGRGAAILASDLPLNLEIEQRAPGSIRYFSSGNPEDLACQIQKMAAMSSEELRRMGNSALEYASSNSPQNIVQKHLGLYRSLNKVLD